MLFQAVLSILAMQQTTKQTDNDPTILIYPDVTEKYISFNITFDEKVCQDSLSKNWMISSGYESIFEDKITPNNGVIHILYSNGLSIKNIRDLGNSYYFPIVCDKQYYEYVERFIVYYRPNFTISLASNSFRRSDELMINGNVTDWDSTKLTLVTKINNKNINQIAFEKQQSSDPVPFSIKIPLNTSNLEENNLTIIITDEKGLTSNMTKMFIIKADKPKLSFSNNLINESLIIGDNLTINVSVDDHDISDFLEFYYSIDDHDAWTFIKNISLINQSPIKTSLSIHPNITEGNHSIYVKCIGSNGLESESYLVKIVSISQYNKTNEESNSSKNAISSSIDTPNNTTSSDDDGSPAIFFIIMLPSIAAIFAAVFVNFYCNKRHEKSSDYSDETEIIISPELKADLGSEIETLFSLDETTFDYFNSEVDSLIDLQSHEPDS